ncbi:ras-related protein Rab-33B-like isoform X2 [Oscarella lobularis]|uniref:ras-related protein Rab-33B-like isoform X2 n=1 Tax=Oscarella lobularis TaxID=121494 RepID=UPI0033138965
MSRIVQVREVRGPSRNQSPSVTYKLQLWDTAGQERFRQSMTSRYYRDVHAVLLVYDVTNRHSFHNLRVWLTEYYNHSPSGSALLFLVGNKNDLKARRVVEQRSGQGFAEAHDFTYFWETSVKEKQDEVNHIFYMMAAMLKKMPRELLDQYSHRSGDDDVIIDDQDMTTKADANKRCCSST